jgi:hypothetical protein
MSWARRRDRLIRTWKKERWSLERDSDGENNNNNNNNSHKHTPAHAHSETPLAPEQRHDTAGNHAGASMQPLIRSGAAATDATQNLQEAEPEFFPAVMTITSIGIVDPGSVAPPGHCGRATVCSEDAPCAACCDPPNPSDSVKSPLLMLSTSRGLLLARAMDGCVVAAWPPGGDFDPTEVWTAAAVGGGRIAAGIVGGGLVVWGGRSTARGTPTVGKRCCGGRLTEH